jgi:hypothetical protein
MTPLSRRKKRRIMKKLLDQYVEMVKSNSYVLFQKYKLLNMIWQMYEKNEKTFIDILEFQESEQFRVEYNSSVNKKMMDQFWIDLLSAFSIILVQSLYLKSL